MEGFLRDEYALANQAPRTGPDTRIEPSAPRISPLVAQLLINRGIDDPGRALAFLAAKLGTLHDPELLPGAMERPTGSSQAIRDRRKIVVYGDYDVDGVCGTERLVVLPAAGGRPRCRLLHSRIAWKKVTASTPRRYGRIADTAPCGAGRDGRLRHLGGAPKPPWPTSSGSS